MSRQFASGFGLAICLALPSEGGRVGACGEKTLSDSSIRSQKSATSETLDDDRRVSSAAIAHERSTHNIPVKLVYVRLGVSGSMTRFSLPGPMTVVRPFSCAMLRDSRPSC